MVRVFFLLSLLLIYRPAMSQEISVPPCFPAHLEDNAPHKPISAARAGKISAWKGYKAVELLAIDGCPELALRQIEFRLTKAPTDARAAYLKGLILMQMKEAEAAEQWFLTAHQRFPSIPQLLNALAAIYASRGDFSSAERVLKSALDKQPDNHTIRANLAYVQLQLARQNYQQALKFTPNDAKIQKIIDQLNTLLPTRTIIYE